MKKRWKLFVFAFGIMGFTFGQTADLELTFTAIDSVVYVQLDSIKVFNRTHGGDTVLYYPDTALTMDIQTAIPQGKIKNNGFRVLQNSPNPVKDITIIPITIPDNGTVGINITDILGRQVLKTDYGLDQGTHCFSFAPGESEMYIFTAYWQGTTSSIKIINVTLASNANPALEYIGKQNSVQQFKSAEIKGDFTVHTNDQLLCVGFMDTLQSGIPFYTESNKDVIFQFAYNMPCPGMATINYDGQEYNTVQVFSQCWLKENLNVGIKVLGLQAMTNNGTIEKYCYYNQDSKCDIWGGLYQWQEAMQYSTDPGTQGICPPDWHIPTDEDIKVLEGSIDSQHGIGDAEWDGWDFRGLDIGYQIKSTSSWSYNGNGSDSFGFTVLPAGARFTNGSFIHSDNHAYLWSSNEHAGDYAWGRLIYTFNESLRNSFRKEDGVSVRCVRNY